MQRHEFDHVIAAAADVTGENEFVVIGSQAVIGLHGDRVPPTLVSSMEVDIYPLRDPAKADAIDAHLGDGSMFHRTYGYYAHGVGPGTAKAPDGWQERVVRVAIPSRHLSADAPIALCIAMNDLVLSKCVAGRERDWEYAETSLEIGLVDIDALLGLVPSMPVEPDVGAQIAAMLRGISARLTGPS